MRKLLLIVSILLLSVGLISAQDRTISGVVVDESGNGVPGASVVVKGTNNGVSTKSDGNFQLSNVPENAIIIFNYIGKQKQELQASSNMRVVMVDEFTELEKVVVVAYGTKKREALTGSVSVLDEKMLQNQQSSSVTKSLEGLVSGVQLSSTTGRPGEDASIFIRGIGSIYAGKSALIVLDGAPYNGSLADINPNDIDNISVSKDASSNTLYGSRAANGVVFVTTKKGVANRPRVSVKAIVGVNTRGVPEYDIFTSQKEYYQMMWRNTRDTSWGGGGYELEGKTREETMDYYNLRASQGLIDVVGGYNSFRVGDGGFLVGTDGKLNKTARQLYDDNLKDAVTQTGIRQEYDISISGGSTATTYYMSFGYLNDDSYYKKSNFERYSGRINVNSNIKSWLNIGANISYTKSFDERVNESGDVGSVIMNARNWAPIYPVFARDLDGKIKLDENGKKLHDFGRNSDRVTPEGGVTLTNRIFNSNQNSVHAMENDHNLYTTNMINTRGYANVYFLKDFTASVDFTYDNRDKTYDMFMNAERGSGTSVKGRVYDYRYRFHTMNFNQILKYSKNINNVHQIDALIGHETFNYDQDAIYGGKYDVFDSNRPNFESAGKVNSLTGAAVEHNMEAYFIKGDYNYKNKYFFNASIRRDGTSRFVNEKWGTFWAIGASWRIAQEDFMSNATWLNELKLRASYGTQGNEATLFDNGAQNYYPGHDIRYFDYDGSDFNISPTPQVLGNPDLSWEKQDLLDIGVDFAMFNNRFTGTIDYFNRYVSGMLYKSVKPTSLGRSYNWENIGKMRNSGIEIELNYKIFNQPDLQWSVGMNMAHIKNKIVKLPAEYAGNNPYIHGLQAGTKKYVEGNDMYSWFIKKWAGVNPETGRGSWYKRQEIGETGKYEIVVTDDYAQASDLFLGKSAFPDVIGGFNTSVAYKGFDLSIVASFQIGGWAYDYAYQGLMSSNITNNKHKDILKAWNPYGNKNSSIPVMNNTLNDGGHSSDRFLIKASYFSLRNITLGYTLPSRWTNKIDVQSLRIYIACDNVAFVSKRKGFDPRLTMGGYYTTPAYATIRTTSVGILVNF